jgi:RNA polymerase sigma factor (sigma-70 family)
MKKLIPVAIFFFRRYNYNEQGKSFPCFRLDGGQIKRMIQNRNITLGDLEGGGDYNKVAFNQVVRDNYKKMIEYCVRNFPGRIHLSDAEDLVHQTFMELLEAIQKGIREKSVPAKKWLFQRLYWRCLNYIGTLGRFQQGEEAEEDIIQQIVDAKALPPDEAAERKEIIDFLRDCIKNRLKGRTQEVIKLYCEGLSQVEIARALGLSEPRVATLRKKGIWLLREYFQEKGFLG